MGPRSRSRWFGAATSPPRQKIDISSMVGAVFRLPRFVHPARHDAGEEVAAVEFTCAPRLAKSDGL